MRLAFLGTPDTAVVALRSLLAAGHDIALVVTRADARRARGAMPAASPVREAAIEAGLAVSHRAADVADAGVDLGVVVAFGQLIRPPVLDVVPMVNLHFSLLPRWRGAAPVERAILAGDVTTGVCLMALEKGLDTGGVYRRQEVTLEPTETADALRARLAQIGSRLLVDTLAIGLGTPEPQSGEATYAAKISSEDRHLVWTAGAEDLARIVRIGRAWTTWRARRLLVLDARVIPEARAVTAAVVDVGAITMEGGDPVVGTGAGGLALLMVQPEGGRPMPASQWWRGARPRGDERLGALLHGASPPGEP